MTDTTAHPNTNFKSVAALAPYALCTSVLFFVVALLVVLLGTFDLLRSFNEQRSRMLPMTVLTISFGVGLGIAAYLSLNAWGKFRKIDSAYPSTLDDAIAALVSFLKVLFLGCSAIALLAIASMFMPAY